MFDYSGGWKGSPASLKNASPKRKISTHDFQRRIKGTPINDGIIVKRYIVPHTP